MAESNQCWTEERAFIQKEKIICWHGWFILKLAWGCRTNTSVSLHSGRLSADTNILKMAKYHIGLAHIRVYHCWKNREKCNSYRPDGKCFEQNGSSQYVNLFSVCNSRLNSMQSKSVRASAGIRCARDIPLVSDRGLRRADSVTSPLHLGPAASASDVFRPVLSTANARSLLLRTQSYSTEINPKTCVTSKPLSAVEVQRLRDLNEIPWYLYKYDRPINKTTFVHIKLVEILW